MGFPHGFIFGTSSSAYQYEGAAKESAIKPSLWDTFSHSFGLLPLLLLSICCPCLAYWKKHRKSGSKWCWRQWLEKWLENYNSSRWADKWATYLEVGCAHY